MYLGNVSVHLWFPERLQVEGEFTEGAGIAAEIELDIVLNKIVVEQVRDIRTACVSLMMKVGNM